MSQLARGLGGNFGFQTDFHLFNNLIIMLSPGFLRWENCSATKRIRKFLGNSSFFRTNHVHWFLVVLDHAHYMTLLRHSIATFHSTWSLSSTKVRRVVTIAKHSLHSFSAPSCVPSLYPFLSSRINACTPPAFPFNGQPVISLICSFHFSKPLLFQSFHERLALFIRDISKAAQRAPSSFRRRR